MKVREPELEEFLFREMAHPETLLDRTGLALGSYYKHFRQVNLGPYGKVDLMTIDFSKDIGRQCTENLLEINIIELKADCVGPETYLQIVRYASGLRHFFKCFFNSKNTNIYINVFLVGYSVSMSAIDAIPIYGIVDSTSVYLYDCDNGVISLQNDSRFDRLSGSIAWGKYNGSSVFYKIFKANVRSIIGSYINKKDKYKVRAK